MAIDVCLNYPFDSAQGAFLRWLSGVEALMRGMACIGLNHSLLFITKQRIQRLLLLLAAFLLLLLPLIRQPML